MSIELLKVQDTGKVIKLTINNPKAKNALSPSLFATIDKILSSISEQGNKILLITGEGDSFSAGADLKYLSQLPESNYNERFQNCQLVVNILKKLYMYPYPVIVAVNGPAIGAATIFLAIADFVIAKEGALIGNPEFSIGFAPFVTFTAIALRTGFEDSLRIIAAGPTSLKQGTPHPLVDVISSETTFYTDIETTIRKFSSINLNAFSRLKLFARKQKWQQFEHIFEQAIQLNAREYESTDFHNGIKKLLANK